MERERERERGNRENKTEKVMREYISDHKLTSMFYKERDRNEQASPNLGSKFRASTAGLSRA